MVDRWSTEAEYQVKAMTTCELIYQAILEELKFGENNKMELV